MSSMILEPSKTIKQWQELRYQILERDGYVFVACNSTDKLHTHHLVISKYGGTDDPDNLLTLCKQCHVSAEPNLSFADMKLLRYFAGG